MELMGHQNGRDVREDNAIAIVREEMREFEAAEGFFSPSFFLFNGLQEGWHLTGDSPKIESFAVLDGASRFGVESHFRRPLALEPAQCRSP